MVNAESIQIPKDWTLEPLSPTIAKIIDTPHYTSPKSKYGTIPIITTALCSYDGINYSNSDFTTYEEYERRNQSINPELGDILFTREAPAGIAVLVDKKEIAVGQRIVLLKINKKIIDNYFLSYFLNSNQNKRQLNSLVIKTTVERINIEEIKKILIPITSIEEQKKISKNIFDINKIIKQLKKLIEKKKNIKQGTMQELLTGKKRLKGFNDKWKIRKLGKITEMFTGGTPLTTNRSFYDGDIPWAVIADITRSKKYLYSTEKNITEKGLKNCSSMKFEKGVLLFAMYASIGKCCISKIDVTCNQAILGIMTKKIDTEFLYQYMTFSEKIFSRIGQTGAQSNLNKEIVQNIDIPYPSEKEQTAIAKILSDMDSEIIELETNRDKYTMIKNGMMQKLLTGEIRLV